MNTTAPCPLCGQPAPRTCNPALWEVTCNHCGSFQILIDSATLITNGSFDGHKVAAYVKERSIRGMAMPILLPRQENISPKSKSGSITLGAAIESFPKTVAERLDRTLLNLAGLTKFLGDGVKITLHDLAIAFAHNSQERNFVFTQLANDNYITMSGVWPGHVSLTTKGFNRVAELQRGEWGSLNKQVFVAMSFDASLDSAYKNGFLPAIKDDCGYDPLRVDLKEHNEDINDVLVAEMRRSKFLVADFTQHKHGVYFEAGFVMGLGRPVIFTCRQDELEDAHFDTRQYNHVAWNDETDLRDKLKRRIQATIVP